MMQRPLWALVLISALGSSTGLLAQDASVPHTGDALHARLFPDAYAAHAARDRASAADLSRILEALPHVRRAEVTYQRAHPADVPLDSPLPSAHVVVALETEGSDPPAVSIETILAIVRKQSNDATVELIQTATTPPQGPVKPTRSDTETVTLRTFLALSLAANVLLATVLLLRLRRGVR